MDATGDEAIGFVVAASTDGGDEPTLYQTVVGFRRDRILGTVRISRLDDTDVREETIALARKLDERVVSASR